MRHGSSLHGLAPDRIAILAALVALHVFILTLRWSSPAPTRDAAPAMQWIIPVSTAAKPSPVPTPSQPQTMRELPRAPTTSQPPAEPESSAPVAPPPIDWAAEAARAAQDHVSRIDKQSRTPASSEPRAPGAIEVVPRQLQSDDFPWSPTGNGEGSVVLVRPPGEVPYLLLWNRCAVSVQLAAMFGCAIGPLPPARGDLFKGMADPNRSRSSVPE